MDAAAHYRHLLALGRDEFLAAAAPAALVRYRVRARDEAAHGFGGTTLTLEGDEYATADETMPEGMPGPNAARALEVYPLAKKPGASFPDRITIGRTPNNDVVIADHSVSRLHAYVRCERGAWVVADAGSKNGSALGNAVLEPRRERALSARGVLRLGDVDLTFYLAADLYAALGGG